MGPLVVTENLIGELVEEVAPLVAEVTGWDLALSSLRVRVLPRVRAYEEIVLGRLRGVGIDFDDNGPRSIVERIIEYVVEGDLPPFVVPLTMSVLQPV